jgi:hypothetical protein
LNPSPIKAFASPRPTTCDPATFVTGMRAAYGKVLVSGMPRMTRPRARKNADGLGGFSVIDPGGNWIRVFQNPAAMPTPAPAPAGRLAKALANAIVLADSKGDVGQAVRILDSTLARPQTDDDPVTHVEVLVYRAELAMVLHDRGNRDGDAGPHRAQRAERRRDRKGGTDLRDRCRPRSGAAMSSASTQGAAAALRVTTAPLPIHRRS